MRQTDTQREKINRIKQISEQIRLLSSELNLLCGGSVRPQTIINVIEQEFGNDPTTEGRKGDLPVAKFAAIFLLKQYTNLMENEIETIIKSKKHSVTQYRYTRAKELLQVDIEFKSKINNCIYKMHLIG